MEHGINLWTWKWVGGGGGYVVALNRPAALKAAVQQGERLGTRGTVLLPDLPTLKIFDESVQTAA